MKKLRADSISVVLGMNVSVAEPVNARGFTVVIKVAGDADEPPAPFRHNHLVPTAAPAAEIVAVIAGTVTGVARVVHPDETKDAFELVLSHLPDVTSHQKSKGKRQK